MIPAPQHRSSGTLNYLAHLLLAEDSPDSRVGNLLGDFVTGRPGSLDLPLPVVQGIIRHRAIDRFTDSHPVNLRLKQFVAPERHRFAGVITDLIHDHFLTLHWDRFSRVPLRTFIDNSNAALRSRFDLLPPELGDTLDERIADDWLGRYGTDEGLDLVFCRVSRRDKRFTPIRQGIADLRRHRVGFEEGFLEFFPQLQAWVQSLGPEAQVVIDRDPSSS